MAVQDDWDEADYEALENGHTRDTESAWDFAWIWNQCKLCTAMWHATVNHVVTSIDQTGWG